MPNVTTAINWTKQADQTNLAQVNIVWSDARNGMFTKASAIRFTIGDTDTSASITSEVGAKVHWEAVAIYPRQGMNIFQSDFINVTLGSGDYVAGQPKQPENTTAVVGCISIEYNLIAIFQGFVDLNTDVISYNVDGSYLLTWDGGEWSNFYDIPIVAKYGSPSPDETIYLPISVTCESGQYILTNPPALPTFGWNFTPSPADFYIPIFASGSPHIPTGTVTLTIQPLRP